MMNLGIVVALLGLVVCGSCLSVTGNVTELQCDSPEADAAAQVALDFINAQHKRGYKYTLNQIEDIKVVHQVDGKHIYLLELEFLETKCHVVNPTPVLQCDVRNKMETAVEADCDVALSKADSQLSVMAFKCKTELELQMCPGCPFLQPLNHTQGNKLVEASLEHFNKNQISQLNASFALLDVGRLSSQVVSGGPLYHVEYAIIETNCTNLNDENCVPLDHMEARHGFCLSQGRELDVKVDCKIFPSGNATLPAPPGPPSTSIGFKNHKLTALHDPDETGLLSVESKSAENIKIVKRELASPPSNDPPADKPVLLLPRCPGKIRHF